MKKEGSLKVVLAILIIVLVSMISLGGFFWKNKNVMENKVNDYNLGMDLKANTVMKLDVVKNEENTSEGTNEENSENNGQAENIYTASNYKKCKEILENRLKKSNIEQFTLRMDENTGSIVIEVSADIDQNTVQQILTTGKIEFKEVGTSDVLIDNSGIKTVTYLVDASSSNQSYFEIDFTKETTNKLQEMYKQVQEEKANSESTDSSSSSDKTIAFSIDGSQVLSVEKTEFLRTAAYGYYQTGISVTKATQEEVENTLKNIKLLAEGDYLPLEYKIEYSNIIHANTNKNLIVGLFVGAFAIMLVYLIFKHKAIGMLSGLTILGFISSLLLIIRYVNITVSVAGLISIGFMMILQFVYLVKLLKNSNITSKTFTENIVEFTKVIVPIIITSVVIAFANILEISGFGMILFWGLILFEIFNNIITRAIVTNVKNK